MNGLKALLCLFFLTVSEFHTKNLTLILLTCLMLITGVFQMEKLRTVEQDLRRELVTQRQQSSESSVESREIRRLDVGMHKQPLDLAPSNVRGTVCFASVLLVSEYLRHAQGDDIYRTE